MIEKLAPEDENKRESYIRQVYAGDAARVPYDFITDPLIFSTRTRTSFRIQLQETPEDQPGPSAIVRETRTSNEVSVNEDL
jgi:hypothetical protein